MRLTKTKLLYIATFLFLAIPLFMTGIASAMYMDDGGVQHATNGGWVTPTDGICVLSLDMSGNMVTDPSITSSRDCQARLVSVTATTPNDTLAHVCGTTGLNTAGVKYAAPGSSTCVTIDGSGYITGAISMKNLDRGAVMCNLLGGQLANATVGTLSNGAAITTATKTTANGTAAQCIAYGWQYRGQDATGTPLTFGPKGVAQGAGTGYCYSVMNMTSAGYTSTTCPMSDANTHPNAGFNSSTAYDWNWTVGTKCTYNKGIKGYPYAALTKADGTTTPITTNIDLSTYATQGECLAQGATWSNWTGQAASTTPIATTPVGSVIPVWDYTKQAPDADAGCLHCHSYLSQANGPAERFKDSYLKTGHKNMLRTVTAGKPWAGPDGVAYTTDGTVGIDFSTATVTPSGKKLFYIYGDWMIAAPTLVYENTVGNNTSTYSCGACHTAGYSDASLVCTVNPTVNTSAGACTAAGGTLTASAAPGVESIGTTGFTPAQPAATFPSLNLGTLSPKWDLNGIQCARCHNAAIGKVVDTQIAASAYKTTQATSGGMGALTATNQGRTDLCFGCHQSQAKVWPAGTTTTLDPTVIPTGASHGAAYGRDFNGHVIGQSFLNSVHGQFTGTVALNAIGKYDLGGLNGAGGIYASKFKGYSCWQTASGNSPAKTKNTAGDEIKDKASCESLYGAGAWRADNGGSTSDPAYKQGTCATCHDVHNSLFVDSQAEAALRKTCQDCHVNNATIVATDAAAPQIDELAIAHPMGAGTPFDTTLYENACVVCHMATQAEANLNQNTIPAHVWRINTNASYNTFPTSAQFYGGSCNVGNPGSFTTPPQYTTSAACTGASGIWTPTTQNRNATMSPDGTFANAVWVDLDLACGQCHGGTLGSSNTHNGAMYFDKSYLAGIAPSMHSSSTVPPTVGSTTPAISGLGVSFTDASSGSPAPAIEVNWGDGQVSFGTAGDAFSHTYGSGGVFNILHTAASNNQYASEFINVTVTTTTGTFSITANSTATSVLFILKRNGLTVATQTPVGTSAVFNGLSPNTYTVTAYKNKVLAPTTHTVIIPGGGPSQITNF